MVATRKRKSNRNPSKCKKAKAEQEKLCNPQDPKDEHAAAAEALKALSKGGDVVLDEVVEGGQGAMFMHKFASLVTNDILIFSYHQSMPRPTHIVRAIVPLSRPAVRRMNQRVPNLQKTNLLTSHCQVILVSLTRVREQRMQVEGPVANSVVELPPREIPQQQSLLFQIL